jgi:hypothetical protein
MKQVQNSANIRQAEFFQLRETSSLGQSSPRFELFAHGYLACDYRRSQKDVVVSIL